MNITDIDVIELLPPYMRDDATVNGLCAAINVMITRLHSCVEKMDFNNNLDKLDESDLDYIAIANNITWYNDSDPKTVKINVIKNAEKVFWGLGTVSAVETVVKDIFGIGTVDEWFNYGGSPYKFKVTTSAVLSQDSLYKASTIINQVKRSQAQMEGFNKLQQGNVHQYYGSARVVTKQITIKSQ